MFSWRNKKQCYVDTGPMLSYVHVQIHFVFASVFLEKKTLRKHAYSNTLKILSPKNGNFSHKKILIFFMFLLKT